MRHAKKPSLTSRPSADPTCATADPPRRRPRLTDPESLERAAQLFRALGDTARLQLLEHLIVGECCVTALVLALGEKFSTVSQRLRLLRAEGLVKRRREGNHLYYALADRHVVDLVENALAHAMEINH